MSVSAFFESVGFTLGVRLARARVRAAAVARLAPQPPPPPPRRGKRRTGPLVVGDQVVYRQGRGTFTGLIVRKALDGRFVVTRDKDGKRVLRPAKLLRRAR